MTNDRSHRGGTDWTRGVFAGAVVGGIGWGLFVAGTVGTASDQAHLDATFGTYLFVAMGISAVCLIAAAVLYRARSEVRGTLARTAAVALVVAPASGWVFLGLLYLQALMVRA